MVQALKSGEIDYVRGVGADQFDALANEPDIKAVEGFANGYTYISFNTRGNQEGYNGSTSALADIAFRDALGYAIDKDRLVEATLNGHGVVGTTNVPPYHKKWHVEPTTPRTFDIEEAKRRLDAAGYTLDADGKRLDKDGKPIELRLTWPDSEAEMSTNAQFLQEWWGELGIGVDAFVTEEGKLLNDLLGPDADGKADWDVYMWGWVGDPDPMSLLSFFTSGQLGGLNDSFFTNARYDELFELQQRATDEATRAGYIAEMQQIVYDEAPYHIPYYDSELHAYRTDKFANWTNQPPDSGTPLFGYGPIGYTVLQAASDVTPAPSVESGAPSDGATAAPTPSGDGAAGVERGRQHDAPRSPRWRAWSSSSAACCSPGAGARRRRRTTSSRVTDRGSRGARRGRRRPLRPRPPDLTGSLDGRPLHPGPADDGDLHDRPDRPAQLRAVPDDAGIAGADPHGPHAQRDPGGPGRDAGALGPGQAPVPRPVRRVHLVDRSRVTSASRTERAAGR